jgi:hypothetical protein
MSILTKYLEEVLIRHSDNPQLTKLSPKAKLILRLIYEDLKAHQFFEGLRALGLDDTFYQPELGSIILTYSGLARKIEDSYSFYFDLLCRHSKGMKADGYSVAKRSIGVYLDLMAERKAMSG